MTEKKKFNVTNVEVVGGDSLEGRLKNVVTSGVRVRLDDITCKEVTVIARKNNTGSIYIGGKDVSSTNFGVELHANESFTFIISNSNMIYIDASINGEGVSYVTIY